MRALRLLLSLSLAEFILPSSPAPLHVLRVSPKDTGDPTSLVTVTFDRPVAGQLDGTVDPHTLFTIAPQVAGTIEWQDPITLRFTPVAPLAPSTTYTVTVANTFQAMDGSRLDQPYQFSFRVGGPRILAGAPVGPSRRPSYLKPDAVFELVVSTPIALETVSKLVYLQLDNTCNGPPVVRLHAVSERAITDSDPEPYRQAGGWDRNRATDGLRRVVRTVPERPLPLACQASLVSPQTLDATSTANALRWPFTTYGPLRLAAVECAARPRCPVGYVVLVFSTPVRGADVLRTVKLSPATKFTVSDTSEESDRWILDAPLTPRTTYTVSVDPALHDVLGQSFTGSTTATLTTTGYDPALNYPTGAMLVERQGFRTIAVRHVNVDTVFATFAAVPDTLEARVLGTATWGDFGGLWSQVSAGAVTRAVAVQGKADVPLVSSIRVPAYNALRPHTPTLTLVRLAPTRVDTSTGRRGTFAITQVTDIGLAARLGRAEAVVWVTSVHDGKPLAGAAVVLYDRNGKPRAHATADSAGLARLSGFPPDTSGTPEEGRFGGGFEGYVAATFRTDRAVVPFSAYTWQLSPWVFNVSGAEAGERIPAAAAVFTERGIYRPGEVVHAKAIVRTGALGALRVPAAGDSVRWVFQDRERGTLRDTVIAASPFGTADQTLPLSPDLPLGTYSVAVDLRRDGSWVELARTAYRVAEYRPPEFLVSVTSDSAPHYANDTLVAIVEARYLFGAPMGRAKVDWTVRRATVFPWELNIPGTDGYTIGESGWWWEDEPMERPTAEVAASGSDTLDGTGHVTLHAALGVPEKGRPARLRVEATVTDVNRQTVTAGTSTVLHPAAFYVGAKPGGDYFWKAGTPQEVGLIAVTPEGRKLPGVAIRGIVVRREWHRVQRERGGLDEQVGEWVPDTVARCDVVSGAAAVPCRFTPAQGGSYVVTFRAKDASGREASTSFYRWATGKGWVPWEDETQFKMDVIPDKTTYNVGDTATVLFASPFAEAEAWITVEREGLLQQRRLRLTSGSTSIKLALTEAYVPNAYVSIVVARGRSAPPGGIGDPGRPTIRVGYAELRVTPRVKRLKVEVEPLAAEYRPGDSARVRVRVRDAALRGQRSEVTLWAVDAGVLALTGYSTPDPIALIYRPRGVALRLGSNLTAVAEQVLALEGVSIKGDEAPGGGGGLAGGDVLRSRFASVAFFLGSVVTDAQGTAIAVAKLPDNLTTFKVMAVAVTAGDRYGSGESSLLVTRPLLARPALPRFLRQDDQFTAGIVVNQRAGGTPTVSVRARARGVTMDGLAQRSVTLAAGRGTEVRFAFKDTTTDSATFRFDVTDGKDSDAVLSRLALKPAYFPRAHTAAGVVTTIDTVQITLPGDIDPARSQLVFGIGTTPLALVGGMYRELAVYPFDCSEQVSDEVLPLIALYRAGTIDGRSFAPKDAARQIAVAVAVLSRRQRPDGGIGLWAADDWTTPWLSAYAGEALLQARAAGVVVSDSVLAHLADYLYRSVHQPTAVQSPVAAWFAQLQVRLGEQVAAVDYLSRLGRTDLAGENQLLNVAAQLAWEDRVRLAQVIARRGAGSAARQLLAPIWAGVRVEGRRAVLADSAVRPFYFWSYRRPLARLLAATLAVDSTSQLVGPLVESLVEEGRAAAPWNTQDYGSAVEALADFTARQRQAARRGYTVTGTTGVVFRSQGQGDVMRELSRNLTGLLATGPDGTARLSLTVAAGEGSTLPIYYFATVQEVPRQRPVRPDQQGIEVERWYEDFTTGKPIISAPEGALVRVRLRIKVPVERRFVAVTDPLPAGLEAVDLSLLTVGGLPGPGAGAKAVDEEEAGGEAAGAYLYDWYYGSWDGGWWSPFDHKEMRDDRVVYVATYLWPGTYTASYVARATTPGVFVRPPAHAEEMYNPAVQGRSDGGEFTVIAKQP